MASLQKTAAASANPQHMLGVLCGLAAGAWLGAAEAPTKLVTAGFSPFAISLCMVAGVFAARWTFPTLMKGTGFVFSDIASKPHLIIWALLAGALWAVANTLTVFAIRDVGLATAFPLWNTNSLIGLLWGWLLFREMRGAGARTAGKVVLGTLAIIAAAIMLGFSTLHDAGASPHAARGLAAAAGASLMWGTMYVPYRKAYLSGMSPLSFVTIFTFGELGTMLTLTWCFDGGPNSSALQLLQHREVLFWLFLGGFIWVIGDLFQQFATKYLGISRGIPLSNTNQLWGLAWGALVFGELATADRSHLALVVGGSLLMILGALAISTAAAGTDEMRSRDAALQRECDRYGLAYADALKAQHGGDAAGMGKRHWWDWAIVAAAVSLFVWLGANAVVPPLAMQWEWVAVLCALLLATLAAGCWALWTRTRFN
ncbi:GRP family sugar transporter [Sphingomonas elodea]|uniref:GRP family sugar transporter n=1 Tax=Sphingomonas elodea TaxID=179878 RepID=UPI00026321D5|nr:GRP family sugar transporter [Sphingomonas elodea]